MNIFNADHTVYRFSLAVGFWRKSIQVLLNSVISQKINSKYIYGFQLIDEVRLKLYIGN